MISTERDERVVVLMPTVLDGERTRQVLERAGIGCHVCRTFEELCAAVDEGAAAALLTEEALFADRNGRLREVLARQPAWSDFPLILVAREGGDDRRAAVHAALNVTLVERPLRMRSLASVLQAALRSRRHQYAVRHHIAEQQLAESELRDAHRRKDEFLALLAHELRNPLAPLRNGLQILQLAGDDARTRQEAGAVMERQLAHMVRLIDDLLDVSRISRNKLDLRKERVSLADVVAAAVETARPLVRAAGHELTVALPAEPVYLDADLTRLAQVFANLLSNSVKYTPRAGHIHLSARRSEGDVIVSVHDDGIGIPDKSLSTIFEMFSQVDRSIERSTGGLGIGLALVKGLVEMHGGTVAAESEGPDMGSTFAVRLSTAGELAPVAAPTEQSRERVRRRILVVDDNRDSADTMGLMLECFGHEVFIAYDGREGVAAAERHRPDVILMDVGMPNLNGHDATRAIRSQPFGRDPVIIALTGWGQDADREKSRQAGCDGHLVKPVKLDDLERTLGALSVRDTK